MGAPRAEALCLNFGGALSYQSGDWAEAEQDLQRAITLYRELGSASGESLSQQRLGVLLTAMGRLDEAWEILADGVAVAERATMRSHCLTRMHASMARNRLAAKDIAAAMQCMEVGAAVAAGHGACVTCSALLLPEAVRVAIAAGDLDQAEVHVRELEALSDEYGSLAWVGMATQARGRLQVARGAPADAIEALRAAAEAYDKAAAPYELARTRQVWAHALRELGKPTDAAALEAAAEGAMNRLGAAGIEGWVVLAEQ